MPAPFGEGKQAYAVRDNPGAGAAPLFQVSRNQPFGESGVAFVLYSDRTVIYRPAETDEPGYRIATLSKTDFDALVAQLTPDSTFIALKSCYDTMPNAFDIPSATVRSWMSGSLKTVYVRGFWKGGPATGAWTSRGDRGALADTFPEEFGRLYAIATQFSAKESKIWKPEYFDAVFDIDRTSYLPPATREWPKDLPQPVPIAGGFIAHLTRKNLQRVRDVASEDTAFLINGRSTRVRSHVVFPSEANWEAGPD